MPRKPSLVPKRKRYSRDLKLRIVYQKHTLGKSTNDIAIDLDIPLRVVQRTLEKWKDVGDVETPRLRNGSLPLLRGQSLDFLVALVERDPDAYLDEIQACLSNQLGVDASIATIDRTLQRLGFTKKKLSRVAQERSEEARRAFTLQVGREPPERLVCADEAAVNILTSYRENGWSFHGMRARKKTRFVRGTRYSLLQWNFQPSAHLPQRYSVLPALSVEGILYSQIKVGSFNGDQFIMWLEGLLPLMNK
ncbi:hypothetical protein ONZ45_g15616 [Pleurotus djamor]|nr:hypothetical protein ONZ45_g15616 [Pleurotus djamor]